MATSTFENLKAFAKAEGFSSIGLDFLNHMLLMREEHDYEWDAVPQVVKAEFNQFMEMGRQMFAPATDSTQEGM